jgi:hypothetical protein
MDTEKAQADFEAWWIKQLWHECFEDVKDQMRNVYVAGWIESRQQVVVELPPSIPMPDLEDDDDFEDFERMEDTAWTANGMRGACRAAIEAAGLTVKE